MHTGSAMRTWFFRVFLSEDGGVGWGGYWWHREHKPLEETQGNVWVLRAVCIPPNLPGSELVPPWVSDLFIQMKAWLACAGWGWGWRKGQWQWAALPPSQDSGGPWRGLRDITAPQGCSTARVIQSTQHPALPSFVCYCHCHFSLFEKERERGIYFILLDLTEPLEGKGNVCGRREGEVLAWLLLETGLMAEAFDK